MSDAPRTATDGGFSPPPSHPWADDWLSNPGSPASRWGDDGHASSDAVAAHWQQTLATAQAQHAASQPRPAAADAATAGAAAGFLGEAARTAPAVGEGLASGAGAAALAGAGVGAMVAGPGLELQNAAAQADAQQRAHDVWTAHDELSRTDPSNHLAGPIATTPGWVPSAADVSEEQAALAEAKARPVPGTCDAAHPHGTPGPSAPATETGGASGKLPPGPPGTVRADGECDEDGNLGATAPRNRLPTDGKWTDPSKPGNSGWESNDPDVRAITGGKPINFENGRPDFGPWAKLSINFQRGELTGDHDKDVATVKKALDASRNPDVKEAGSATKYLDKNDLTAHHATDTCIQLVPKALNQLVPHIGSAADLRYQRSMEGHHDAN